MKNFMTIWIDLYQIGEKLKQSLTICYLKTEGRVMDMDGVIIRGPKIEDRDLINIFLK